MPTSAALVSRTRAAVFVSLLVCGPAAWADVLVLRNGEARQGELRSCIGGRCHLSGEAVDQADAEWIGLGQNGSPPMVRSSTSDQVVLVGGGMRSGRFVGLSLGSVSLERESIDRPEVAWIRLAAVGLIDGGAPVPIAAQRCGPFHS